MRRGITKLKLTAAHNVTAKNPSLRKTNLMRAPLRRPPRHRPTSWTTNVGARRPVVLRLQECDAYLT